MAVLAILFQPSLMKMYTVSYILMTGVFDLLHFHQNYLKQKMCSCYAMNCIPGLLVLNGTGLLNYKRDINGNMISHLVTYVALHRRYVVIGLIRR
jgi:hypothetical protein